MTTIRRPTHNVTYHAMGHATHSTACDTPYGPVYKALSATAVARARLSR